jgi:hypothetical protein
MSMGRMLLWGIGGITSTAILAQAAPLPKPYEPLRKALPDLVARLWPWIYAIIVLLIESS